MDNYTERANTQTDQVNETQSTTRRNSFGIHISERNVTEPESGPSSTYINRREFLRQPSRYQQSPTHDRHPFSPPGLWDITDSQCDDSDFTTNDIRDSSAISSANYASPTSVSSAPWSPLDSPIDEEVMFRAGLRDEYYMADGKNSSFYPDHGDLPAKREEIAGDRHAYYGPGSDPRPLNRLRVLTRENLSRTMHRSFPRDNQGSEEQEDGDAADNVASSSQAQV